MALLYKQNKNHIYNNNPFTELSSLSSNLPKLAKNKTQFLRARKTNALIKFCHRIQDCCRHRLWFLLLLLLLVAAKSNLRWWKDLFL
jgi:hypothetical protein